jgi:hypothetical protein
VQPCRQCHCNVTLLLEGDIASTETIESVALFQPERLSQPTPAQHLHVQLPHVPVYQNLSFRLFARDTQDGLILLRSQFAKLHHGNRLLGRKRPELLKFPGRQPQNQASGKKQAEKPALEPAEQPVRPPAKA